MSVRVTETEARKLGAKLPARKRKALPRADGAALWPLAVAMTGGARPEVGVWAPEFRFAPGRRWRFDWACVPARVAIEVDGGRWKPGGGRHGSDADREKLNEAAVLGWRVLRFSPAQLRRDPAGCVAVVIRALAYRLEAR